MSVFLSSIKGKRPSNEDRHTVVVKRKDGDNSYDINIYGVYDGHGGSFVSKYLCELMPDYLSKLQYPVKKSIINKVFEKIEKNLKQQHPKKIAHTGSTCINVIDFLYKSSRYLKIINVGDSRGVICKKNLAIPLTKDHKPNSPEEKNRIEKNGGSIYQDIYGEWRVGDLSLSRAIGDHDTPLVISRPEVYLHRVTKNDSFFILACDGLWDVMSNQDAVDYVISNCYDIGTGKKIIKREKNIAKMLGERAIELGSTDNVTTIVVFLN